MYRISVETNFDADHQVRMPGGTLEDRHGHNWCVRAVFASRELNDLEMVVDFLDAERALRQAIRPLDGAFLNGSPAFAGRNPTAELVARFIADRLVEHGLRTLQRVEVTEAPGCVASFEVDSPFANCR